VLDAEPVRRRACARADGYDPVVTSATDELEIRPARTADGPVLGRMGRTLSRLHHRLDRTRFFAVEDAAGYEAWLTKEGARRNAVVLVAVERGRGRERVVGYAYGRLEGTDWETLRPPAGVAVDLYVAPRLRRRGLARRLVEALVAELRGRGAELVVLHVAARNARAEAAFARMGFRRTMVEMAIDLR
jgi:ribosomal protein S18 acetylase RimI-like enzyme